MKTGISKIKGAVRVLKDMDYPDEIRKLIKGAKYQEEIKWIVGLEERNKSRNMGYEC